jgi:hypothetical protein
MYKFPLDFFFLGMVVRGAKVFLKKNRQQKNKGLFKHGRKKAMQDTPLLSRIFTNSSISRVKRHARFVRPLA